MDFLYLIVVSLALGLVGLAAFFWSLKNEQYGDMDGDAQRVLMDNHDDVIAEKPNRP